MSVKKLFKNTSFLLCPLIFILFLVFLSIFWKNAYEKFITINKIGDSVEDSPKYVPDNAQPNVRIDDYNEMRGIWVPFMDLDIRGNCQKEYFENKIKDIINTIKKYKLNTLVIQIRSHSDAMYPSTIFPWSHFLTGTQGQDPGFDPLKIIVDESKRENIKIHVWINPFRIQCSGFPHDIAKNNPYMIYSEEKNFISKMGDDIYYNPANEKVRQIIVDGVKEVIEKYDVDAVHLDDRFYPTDDENFDKTSYNEYLNTISDNNEKLNLLKWRQNNINSLISKIYDVVKKSDKKILFGVSPEGNILNAQKHGVDVQKWCNESGYMDYICPQLYWSLDNPALSYKEALDRWKNMFHLSDVKFYCGLSLYKIGTNLDDNTWNMHDNEILKKELEYAREHGCNGFILYPYNCLNKAETQKELSNLVNILD